MVMAYYATNEDRLLENDYRIYNGKKIDIRWSGGWLTPEGKYFPVDYRNGITHATIAEEYGNKILGSGSITTCPPIMRIFGFAGWIRITYLEGSSFCVDLKGAFVCEHSIVGQSKPEIHDYQHRRQRNLLRFVKDYKSGFDSYFINDTEYKNYYDFIAAIRNNKYIPKGEDNGYLTKLSWKLLNYFRLYAKSSRLA